MIKTSANRNSDKPKVISNTRLNRASMIILRNKTKEFELNENKIKIDMENEFGPDAKKINQTIMRWRKLFAKSYPIVAIYQMYKQLMCQGIDYHYKKNENTSREHYDYIQQHLSRFKNYRFIIDPDGMFFRVWSVILMIMMLQTILYIPFNLTFRSAISPHLTSQPTQSQLWWFEVVFEVLFILDIFINFFIPQFDADNELRCEYQSIATKQISEQFIIDLFGAFPTNLMSFLMTEQNIDIRLIKLLKFPRMQSLVKLTKVNKIFEIMKNIEFLKGQMEFFIYNAVVLKFLQYFVFMMLGGHLFACLFVLSTVGPGKTNGWLYNKGLLVEDEDFAVMENKQQDVWLQSIYWAFTTITTTGQGDIVPDPEIAQLVLVIILSIVGVVVNSLLNSNLSTALSESENNQTILAKKVTKFFTWANFNKMSQNQKVQIRDQLEQRMNKYNLDWIMEKGIFEELPDELKYEISMNTQGGALRNIRFFSKRTLTFIVEYVLKLYPMRLTSKSLLYKIKDNVEEVFFIQKGRLSLATHECIIFKTFITNSQYGDVELILNLPNRIYSVQAEIETDLLVMSKNDFLDIRKSHYLQWPEIELNSYKKHFYSSLKKQDAIKEVRELMHDKTIRKSNKEKLNQINLIKQSHNYKLLTQLDQIDLILQQASETFQDATNLLFKHLLTNKHIKIQDDLIINIKDPKNQEIHRIDKDQIPMIEKIVDLQNGSKDLREKLKGAINDLKNVIEFKEKHSSADKDAFKNAIQINDDNLTVEMQSKEQTKTLKRFELLDNSDKINFLLYLTDWFLKRDKVKVNSKINENGNTNGISNGRKSNLSLRKSINKNDKKFGAISLQNKSKTNNII